MSDKLYVQVSYLDKKYVFEADHVKVYVSINQIDNFKPFLSTEERMLWYKDLFGRKSMIWVEYNEDLSIFKKNIEEAITLMEII